MNLYSLDNPVFRIYVVAAALAVLKLIAHAFLTVHRMMRSRGGYLNPEDLRATVLNPQPDPRQIQPVEDVERARRMHRNELENTPAFLAAGLLFVAAAPGVALAATLLYGYVLARVLHAWAYLTARDHEVRATFFTLGALATVAMALYALVAVARA